jgi:uncharacterized phage protein gp47/JayE
MSGFGLTTDGFTIKRLQDIKADLEANFRAQFGEIDVSASSVFGQIIGVTARPLADLWGLMELIYLSQAPLSAEGVQLDNVAQYTGLTRLPATPTRAWAVLFTNKAPGDAGYPVLVSALTQVSTSITQVAFELENDTTIQATDCLQTTIEVVSASTGVKYTVTINGTASDHTAGGGETVANIATALIAQIGIGGEPVAVTDHGDGTFTIVADDLATSFSIAVTDDDTGARIAFDEIGTRSRFEAQDAGSTPAPQDTLTVIDTPVSGFDRVNNLVDADIGRDIETDAELRARRAQSLQVAGAATLSAIRAKILQEVDGVSEVAIYENRTATDYTPSGLPPHSFQCVVVGGDEQEIGQKIWDTKPAGIETWGGAVADPSRVEVPVIDSNGDTQNMYFSRPTSKYAFVKVRFDAYTEETFPAGGIDTIKQSILDFGNEFRIGEDMIRDRFYAAIYNSGVSGIGTITLLQIAAEDDPNDAPVYGTANIAMGSADHAVFALEWGTGPQIAIDVEMNP